MSANPRLVLGSGSPRRRDLLRQLGLEFEQIASPEEEPAPANEAPDVYVLHSARAKARAVHRLLQRQSTPEPAIVIGADTTVCLGHRFLGKPAGAEQAAAMLQALSGRTHEVYTGIGLIAPDGRQTDDVAVTRVHMRPLSSRDIQTYVASGEPLDKAGAYGIQGLAARFIERIEGCYYNVVGLPLARLSALLEEAGYDFTAADPNPSEEP